MDHILMNLTIYFLVVNNLVGSLSVYLQQNYSNISLEYMTNRHIRPSSVHIISVISKTATFHLSLGFQFSIKRV